MKKLYFAFFIVTSFASLQASNEPPCNHETLDEAWDDDDKSKDDNECGHHHHCG